MAVNLPGLLRERLPSGRYRWRVRVAGDKRRRISLPFGFADERGYVRPDPAAGLRVTYRSRGGAVPWSIDDLKQ